MLLTSEGLSPVLSSWLQARGGNRELLAGLSQPPGARPACLSVAKWNLGNPAAEMVGVLDPSPIWILPQGLSEQG